MRIQGARMTHGRQLDESSGDVWSTAWAADGRLFAVSDDTRGFRDACNSNLAMNLIGGETVEELAGETINPMAAYGALGETGPDGATWKANGLTCVDGTLYLSVSRHRYGTPPFFIQQTWDASIIASRDGGRTWSPAPALGRSMFPGRVFSTPFFVQYGQDGRGEADGADEYIYAVSSDGVWNNGTTMALGRVRRAHLADLDARAWEYLAGVDGAEGPVWTSQPDRAAYLIRAPGQVSMTGIHYIAPLGLYLLPQWHYVYPRDTAGLTWRSFVSTVPTRIVLYAAERPWGPWREVLSEQFAEGWYNPTIPAKFISADGRRFLLFVASCGAEHYHLNVFEVELDLA